MRRVRSSRKRIVGAMVAFGVAALGAEAAVSRQATDTKSCPSLPQLASVRNVWDAVPSAMRASGLSESTGDVVILARGDYADFAPVARRACGPQVVKLSVYVRIHPRGVTCSACDARDYVVRYRTGRYRVWQTF